MLEFIDNAFGHGNFFYKKMYMLLFAASCLAYDVELTLQIAEAITAVDDFESISSDRYFKSLNEDGSRSLTEISGVGLDVAARIANIASQLVDSDRDLLVWTNLTEVRCVDLDELAKDYDSRMINFKLPRLAMNLASMGAATTVALSLRTDACGYTPERLRDFLKRQLGWIYRMFHAQKPSAMSSCFKSKVVLILDRMDADLDPYTHPVPSLDVCMQICKKRLHRNLFTESLTSIVSIYGEAIAAWQNPSSLGQIQTWFNIRRGPSDIELLYQQSGFSLKYIRSDGKGRLQLRSACSAEVSSDDIATSTWVHAAVAFRAGSVSLILNGQESVRPWTRCPLPESAEVKLGKYQSGTEVRFHDLKLSADPDTPVAILPTMFQLEELGDAVPTYCRTEKGYEVAIGFTQCVPAVPFVFRTAVIVLEDGAPDEVADQTITTAEESDHERVPSADADKPFTIEKVLVDKHNEDYWTNATCIMTGSCAVLMLLFSCCIGFQLRRHHKAVEAQIQAAFGDGRV